jgi:hypothetical protein
MFNQSIKKLAASGQKAMFSLLKSFNQFNNLKVSFMYEMFEKLITPIITYGSEVWGFAPTQTIERLHLKFCKFILGVKTNTQNDFVYGELGILPLYIKCYISMLKYWLKIVHGQKHLYVNVCYNYSLYLVENGSLKIGWTATIRDMLLRNGFGEVWYNQGVGNADIFLQIFRERLADTYKQNWHDRIHNSSRASFYRSFKSVFNTSHYLDIIHTENHRKALTKLIVSSHNLRIESGRWERPTPPANERMCHFCLDKIEDEYHFLLECPNYANERSRLMPKYFRTRTSMYKCVELINSGKRKTIISLAKFVFQAFKKRNKDLLNET